MRSSAVIWGVHGVRNQGERNVDLLIAHMDSLGFDGRNVDQRRRMAITAAWHAQQDANELAGITKDGDVLVAHSYGCLKSLLAMRVHSYAAVFLYAPAAPVDWDWKRSETPPSRVYCIYTPHDTVIKWGARIPFSQYGKAGIQGFDDPRVTHRPLPDVVGHSDFFKGDRGRREAQYLSTKVKTVLA